MKDINTIELAIVVDNACDDNNKEKLSLFISSYKDYVEQMDDSYDKTYLFYIISNAWNGLRSINHQENKKDIWVLEQKELFQEIIYLRKACLENTFIELPKELQLNIYTNLGNAFSHYGRTINALKYYNKALAIDSEFFMALANKGMCLKTYSRLNYDDNHSGLIIKESYHYYKNASNKIIKLFDNKLHTYPYYKNIKIQIDDSIQEIENHINKQYLNKDIDLNSYNLRNYKNEKHYKKWIISHNLFLNPLNDLGNYSIATHDPLSLPNLITNTYSFPKIITLFNQLKQEFITSRYLLYEGLNELTKKYYDRETNITDDYDYNLYSIDIEKIKLSFRGFYSIFDKIAVFINEYFKLNLNEKSVDFRSVWYKNNKINKVFQNSENLSLRGLYLISKDLYFNKTDEQSKEFINVLEPEAQEINKIRNHLEHKFIMIKLLDINEFDITIDNRERTFYITYDNLENKTLHLSSLVREALIYLSFTVHIEESKKVSEDSLKIDIPLFYK